MGIGIGATVEVWPELSIQSQHNTTGRKSAIQLLSIPLLGSMASISRLGLPSSDRRSSVCMGMIDERHGLNSDPPCKTSTWCKRSLKRDPPFFSQSLRRL